MNVAPCWKRHALASIPTCMDCAKLLIAKTSIALPPELVDAAYRGKFLSGLDVGTTRYFFRDEIHKLGQQDDKTRWKLMQITSPKPLSKPLLNAPKAPPTKIESSPAVVSTPPVRFRVTTPTKAPTGIREGIREGIRSSDAVRPSKVQKLSEHTNIPVPDLPVAVGTPRTPLSFSVGTPKAQIPPNVVSVSMTTPTKQPPQFARCAECGTQKSKRRQCTNNHLCAVCRQLPQHKLISDQNMFRTFRNLRYADVDRGIQGGTIRRLQPAVFIERNQSQTTNYFYEQDILKIV